jgi:hypothetical protein
MSLFTTEDLERAIGGLRLLRFNPLADPQATAALMEELAAMCPHRQALEWLAKRAPNVYTEWPGLRELRALLCSRFKPADGIDIDSAVYVDGIPSERLMEPERLALPPGHQTSADLELEGMIADLAVRKMLPPATPEPDKCQGCGCTRGKGLIIQDDVVVPCPQCMAYTAKPEGQ